MLTCAERVAGRGPLRLTLPRSKRKGSASFPNELWWGVLATEKAEKHSQNVFVDIHERFERVFEVEEFLPTEFVPLVH